MTKIQYITNFYLLLSSESFSKPQIQQCGKVDILKYFKCIKNITYPLSGNKLKLNDAARGI